MEDLREYVVAGFSFSSEKEAENAREEEKKIYYIKRRLNYDDPRSVLVIYNKMVTGRVFKSPIGMGFLAEVYEKLAGSGEILPDELEPIPLLMATSIGQIEADESPVRRITHKKPQARSYRKEYNVCRLIIAVLVCIIIAMFAITANAENPNILNYESVIQNKYSSWAQELKEKEDELRAREKELLERE